MEDNRYIKQEKSNIVILAPVTGKTRSYHSGGSSAEVFKAARRAFKLIGGTRRARRTVLFSS